MKGKIKIYCNCRGTLLYVGVKVTNCIKGVVVVVYVW
jgi:hypothetical protein